MRGTLPYTVELWVEGEEPGWSCTCPYAEDGSFCKHCVAVGVMVADDPMSLLTLGSESDEQVHESDGPSHVAELSREQLVEIVLDQCATDWRLRVRTRRLLADGPGL